MRQASSRGSMARWLPWLVNVGIGLGLRAALPITLEPGGERYRYYAMSQMFPIQHCPSFHCFRVLPPLFASLLPLQVADAFVVTGFVFQVLAAVVLWHLARKLSGSTRVAWLTIAWYWATWAPIQSFNDPLLITDPVQAFWSFTALYLLFDRRHAVALLLLVAGAAVKESLLLIPMIYAAYTLMAGERRRPSIARLAVLVAVPIAAWAGFRFFLHYRYGYYVAETVGYVRQTYFFGVWLKNLAPWPVNLRMAALYIFGSYGAGWVFAILGLIRGSRRQRALTAASIPPMLVLALLQVPDRALAAFPYAILIPAATFTARLPGPLAWSVLLVNAAFTIRMNTTVAWLPRTPVLLALLAALIVASVVFARRDSARDDEEEAGAHAADVRRLAWAALAATAMFACLALWHGLTDTPPFRLGLPADTIAIADDDGGTPGVAVAPDGRRVVFVGINPSRAVNLYIRPLTAAAETALEGTDGASAPFWSPDGTRIAFFAGGKLKAITLATRAVDVLADAPHPRGGAWSRRDVILFAPSASGGLYQVSSRGGQPRQILAPESSARGASYRWPAFLPDSTRFLFVAARPDERANAIYLGSLSSSTIKPLLTSGKSPIYAPGHLLFARGDSVWAQPFDTRREVTLGVADEVAARVARSVAFDRASFSLGGDTLAIGTDTARSALVSPVTHLRWFDRRGVQISEGLRPLFTSTTRRDLPEDEAATVGLRAMRLGGVWAADGSRFAYAETVGSSKTRSTSVKEERVGSADARVLATDLPIGAVLTSWSPDGSTLLFHAEPQNEHGSWDIWTLPLSSGRAAPLINTAANEAQAQISPDGKWLAYASDETGRYEIFVQPYPAAMGAKAKWQVSTEGGIQPRWRGDGRELFFVVGDRFLAAAAIETPADAGGALRGASKADPPRELFNIGLPAIDPRHLYMDYAVTPDGQHVVVNGPVGEPPSGRLAVWLNWTRGLTETR